MGDDLIYMKHKKVLNNAKENPNDFLSSPEKKAARPVANFKLETPSERRNEHLAEKGFRMSLCTHRTVRP